MFFSFKLKKLLAFIFIIILVSTACFLISMVYSNAQVSNPLYKYTIMLDAGHGGIDGGSVGAVTGNKESDVNLQITKKLERILTGFGFRVVLTRKDSNGLYAENSRNRKMDDMEKRWNLINAENPNLFISIHANSFPSKNEHGAQVFYLKESEEGEKLANCVQGQLFKNVPLAREFSNFADLYILRATENPSILVECGFLSNPEEDQLLGTEEHQQQIAYHIFCGIVRYFEISNNTESL